jgi:HAD superfamily hydrolase (TIGR01509 family)
MTKRTVIFDFGGVIFKTRDYSPRHAWDARLGLEVGSVERAVHNSDSWRAAQHGTLTLHDYWADVAGKLGISVDVAETQLAHDFYSGDVMDETVVDLIRKLLADGYSVALLSNDAAGLLRPRLGRLGITDLFDPLIISSEIGVMKPDPGAYRAVLERVGRPAADTIFIDDMQANIDGARALGIHGIHYWDGMDLEATLKPLLTIGG